MGCLHVLLGCFCLHLATDLFLNIPELIKDCLVGVIVNRAVGPFKAHFSKLLDGISKGNSFFEFVFLLNLLRHYKPVREYIIIPDNLILFNKVGSAIFINTHGDTTQRVLLMGTTGINEGKTIGEVKAMGGKVTTKSTEVHVGSFPGPVIQGINSVGKISNPVTHTLIESFHSLVSSLSCIMCFYSANDTTNIGGNTTNNCTNGSTPRTKGGTGIKPFKGSCHTIRKVSKNALITEITVSNVSRHIRHVVISHQEGIIVRYPGQRPLEVCVVIPKGFLKVLITGSKLCLTNSIAGKLTNRGYCSKNITSCCKQISSICIQAGFVHWIVYLMFWIIREFVNGPE